MCLTVENPPIFRLTPLLVAVVLMALVAGADEPTIPGEALVLSSSASSLSEGRRRSSYSLSSDSVKASLLAGTFDQNRPEAGASLDGDDKWKWAAAKVDEKGVVQKQGLYTYIPVESDRAQVMILVAAGQGATYVNGVSRCANVYGRDYVHLPIQLSKGVNDLLLRAGRGQLKARLYEPPAEVFLLNKDMTLPDLIVGETTDTFAAVIVINATDEAIDGLVVVSDGELLDEATAVAASIPPMSLRKVAFNLAGVAPTTEGKTTGTLELRCANGDVLNRVTMNLKVVDATANQKRTFVSDIDGSVQYYGLRPAVPLGDDDPGPALVLSCHGAAVQASRQTASYSTKSWAHHVAPTNRRPFGFDWEDFGRVDAMEVLNVAKQTLPHDPSRVFLTGHSMGGHGAWHLAVTYPDQFAATGPSAGWLSRASYGRSRGRDEEDNTETTIESIMTRGNLAGDTMALKDNLKQMGVYILHGAIDDNVPASQAKRMAEALDEFHHDWDMHLEPGKKHWWSNEFSDGGAACVDWPDMFDLFARHALPPTQAVRHVEFVTANPGASSRCHWLSVEAQQRHQQLSKVDVRVWPNKMAFRGATTNVAVLRLDVGHLRSRDPITIELDGDTLEDVAYPEANTLWLSRETGEWGVSERPSHARKGSHRYGAIKNELRNRFLFVYGTRGDDEENAAIYAKARLDAESFWYRGNGSVDVVRDVDFVAADYPDRTVVVYGSANNNAAWRGLLGDSPVQVRNGKVTIGRRAFHGDGLSAYFIQPRRDSEIASVIVVGASGVVGMRATSSVSFFIPFTRYPDCSVMRASTDDGQTSVLAAGYFGPNWSMEGAEFAYTD